MNKRRTFMTSGILFKLALLLTGTCAVAANAGQLGCGTIGSPESIALPAAEVVVKAGKAQPAGMPFLLSWTVPGSGPLPGGTAAYLAISMPEAVRFELLKKDSAEENAASAPGMIALPPASRGPRNIAFGAHSTRAFVPLSADGQAQSGAILVKAYRAGPFELSWAVVAKSGCDYAADVTGAVGHASLTVAPGAPEVVIQDLTSDDKPVRVFLSDSGKYELQIFEAYYRVLDAATREKVLERAGYFPNFSPDSRFVAAQVGTSRRGTQPLEIVDLESRQVIESNLMANTLGWVEGDALYVSGSHPYGELTIHQSLVDLAPEEDRKAASTFVAVKFGGSNSNVSWHNHLFNIDLDSGVIVSRLSAPKESVKDGRGWLVDLATGDEITAQEGSKDLVQPAWEKRSRKPFAWPTGWQRQGMIVLSHYDPYLDESTPKWYPGWPLQKPLFHEHQPLAATAERTTTALKVRGPVREWRGFGVVPQARVAPSSNPERFVRALADFSIGLQEGKAPESLVKSASFDVRNPRQVVLQPHFSRPPAQIEAELRREVPAAGKFLDRDPSLCGAGDYEDRGADLSRDPIGIWKWQAGGARYWLVQDLCIYKGFVLYDRLFLFASRPGEAGTARRLDADAVFGHEDQDSDFKWDEHSLKIVPSIVSDRYLVLSSVYGRAAIVADLQSPGLDSRIASMQNADAVISTYLTSDNRLVQVGGDGQFFLYDLIPFVPRRGYTGAILGPKVKPSAEAMLSGRYIDDEIVIYDKHGYYWASFEGAHFVHYRFPGQPGLKSFYQFRSQRERPGIVKAILAGQKPAYAGDPISPPPTADLTVEASSPAGITAKVSGRAVNGLARLRLFADGQLVQERQAEGESVEAAFDLQHLAKARWLTASAVDRRGFVSEPASVELPETGGQGRRLYGLAAGVNDYDDPHLQRLSYAVSDAGLFVSAMRQGARTYYETIDIQAVDQRMPAAQLKRELERIVAAAQPSDTITFFFSGHGGRDPSGHLFLMTANSKVNDPGATALSWGDIAGIFALSKARVMIFLDACHSGASEQQAPPTNEEAVRALAGMRAPILIFASSKGRQTSEESRELKAGVFTSGLFDVLARNRSHYDLNGNGTLEVSEVYRGLKSYVLEKTGGTQTPWLARFDLVGEFALF